VNALALVALTAATSGQEELLRTADAVLAPALEGPLDNDAFVAVAEPVVARLAAGDAALERARAAGDTAPAGERERQLDLAMDQWHAALTGSAPGAWVWYDPAPAGAHRLCEGVRSSVERRLLALTSQERAHWRTRLLPATKTALERLERGPMSERPALAAEFVRLHPQTEAAARAALQLGDLALEAGLGSRAAGWYARAELEAELAEADGPLRSAIEARRKARPPPLEADQPAWHRATGMTFVDASVFAPLSQRGGSLSTGHERRPSPGGVFLADGRFALQCTEELRLYELDPSGALALTGRAGMEDLLGSHTPELRFVAPRIEPGWPLLPAAHGEQLALVVGRLWTEEPNVLLTLEVEPPTPHAALGLDLGPGAAGVLPTWALVGSELVRGDDVRSLSALEALGEFEFQPGPAFAGDHVVVQARSYEGRVRAWLLAFDRRTGELAWQLELASGAERVPAQRFSSHPPRLSAQPLLSFEHEGEPRVFAGTHLGFGALTDGLLGEPLYGLKNRRRAEHEPGWGGGRPLLGAGRGAPDSVLWAPMDSDRLYVLRLEGLSGTDVEERAAMVALPAPRGDARTLLGGDAREHLVLGNVGRARTLSARRVGANRVDALDLGEDELFRGTGLVGPDRAWVATDRGLYLFDRTRELYLLDSAAFPPAGEAPAGGDVHGRDGHVLVVGHSAVWSFRVR
jgi:hypothetical protein